jgi:hypothetical protein
LRSPGRKTLALAVSGLMVCLLTACGHGGDQEATARTQFRAQANAICKDADADNLRATGRKFGRQRPSSDAELIRFVRRVILPRYQQRLGALRQLDPPAGDADQVRAILDSLDVALTAARKQPLTTTVGDQDPYSKADRLARGYGLNKCVYG